MTIHLCDWLEQVARWGQWDHRREAFERMAQRLGGIAEERFAEVFRWSPQIDTENSLALYR